MIDDIKQLAESKNIEFHLWWRKKNLGLATSIISAIDWFFLHEEEGVILEDDLLIDKTFFDFVIDNLDKFRSDLRVWIISGNNFFPEKIGSNWSTYPLIWGWATWKDRWNEIRNVITRLDYPHLSLLQNSGRFWSTGKRRALKGYINSWAIPLAASQHALGRVSVLPNVNLVANVGDDIFSTHSNIKDWHLNKSIYSWVKSTSEISKGFFANDNCDREIEKYVYRMKSYSLMKYFFNLFFDKYRFRKTKSSDLNKLLSNVQFPF